MRERDLLSFSAHWKDDVHRAQKQRNGDILRYKDRTYSVATEYQWAATSDLDFIGAIGYDWRESRRADKGADDNDQHAFNWEVMSKYTFANRTTCGSPCLTAAASRHRKSAIPLKNQKTVRWVSLTRT